MVLVFAFRVWVGLLFVLFAGFGVGYLVCVGFAWVYSFMVVNLFWIVCCSFAFVVRCGWLLVMRCDCFSVLVLFGWVIDCGLFWFRLVG